MRADSRIIMLTAALFVWGCGGSDGAGPGNPAGPSGPEPQPGGSDPPITINIVGDRGTQSFSPNPASVPDGRRVIWRNMDVLVHQVMLDDRSVNTGPINPGASSAPMAIGGVKPYHCPLHPSMVGSINGQPGGAPGPVPEPCADPTCY